MSISRRQFCESLMVGGALGGAPATEREYSPFGLQQAAGTPTGSHIGNLFPFVKGQADRSEFELSFLRPEFTTLAQWQPAARTKILEHLFYSPPPVAPRAQLVRRTDKGDYVEEYLTFQTTPDLRVPAYVLIPKRSQAAGAGDRRAPQS